MTIPNVHLIGTVTDTYGRPVPVYADHDAVKIGDHAFGFAELEKLLSLMDQATDVAAEYAREMAAPGTGA